MMTTTSSSKVPRATADAPPSEAPLAKRPRTEDTSADASTNGKAPNLYAGFQVPVDGYAIERVCLQELTPEAFFTRFVATRTPVVLTGFLQDESFTAPARWTNAYLRETAGDARLRVEERGNSTENFGRGIEVDMAFRDLLELIENGDDLHYLTTQDVELSEDGRPEIMAPFVARLQDDFPLRPDLMGHLVPQNINIWMGNNKHGSSSGLHHDYHDNLYILLRGKKRFRLYSPADTENMYVRGKLLKVHANGRINYEGEETTAYGADLMSEAAALASLEKDEAEKELALAETAVENGEPGAEQRLAQAEERLDKAMLKLLRADRDDPLDEDEPDDGEDGPFHFENEEEDEEVEEEEKEEESADDRKLADKTVKDPINFSRVDTAKLKQDETKRELLTEFPLFKEAKAAYCEINVGEMLFLPASWFHEVESFGSTEGHLALNYWFHPPDQLDKFEAPYSSPFWPRDWALRMAGETEGDQDDYVEDEDEENPVEEGEEDEEEENPVEEEEADDDEE
jgi:hypothetical protein